jgi:hypothetical protein
MHFDSCQILYTPIDEINNFRSPENILLQTIKVQPSLIAMKMNIIPNPPPIKADLRR